MDDDTQFSDTQAGDDYRTRWLKTLRPLEDAQVAPRERLEAYFDMLEFVCDLPRPSPPARLPGADDHHGGEVLLHYTHALLAELMRRAGLAPPRFATHLDVLMRSSLAVTGWTPLQDTPEQLRAELLRLKRDVLARA